MSCHGIFPYVTTQNVCFPGRSWECTFFWLQKRSVNVCSIVVSVCQESLFFCKYNVRGFGCMFRLMECPPNVFLMFAVWDPWGKFWRTSPFGCVNVPLTSSWRECSRNVGRRLFVKLTIEEPRANVCWLFCVCWALCPFGIWSYIWVSVKLPVCCYKSSLCQLLWWCSVRTDVK